MINVETHTFVCPLFPNVETTYVITLASQPERKEAMLARLRQTPLTRTVRFIVSPGGTAKNLGMNTCDDLLHTIKFICYVALASGHPAILLEDDCEFTAQMTPSWAMSAEKRIGGIDAITFGAFMGLSISVNRHWIRILRGGLAHGMLLSPAGMAILLRLPYTRCAHDSFFYARANVVAPRWPVGVQRHHRTKNSLVYDQTGFITFVLTSVFHSDVHPELLYNCSHTVGLFGGLYALVALFLVMVMVAVMRQ